MRGVWSRGSSGDRAPALGARDLRDRGMSGRVLDESSGSWLALAAFSGNRGSVRRGSLERPEPRTFQDEHYLARDPWATSSESSKRESPFSRTER